MEYGLIITIHAVLACVGLIYLMSRKSKNSSDHENAQIFLDEKETDRQVINDYVNYVNWCDENQLQNNSVSPVSYTHLTLPTTPYV